MSSAEAQSEGKIEVCRMKGVSELMDGKSVPIPAGTGFVNTIDPATGSDLDGKNFQLETTEDALLPPKPGCVTISARIRTSDGKAIGTAYKGLLPTQLNVAGLSVLGKIVSGFASK